MESSKFQGGLSGERRKVKIRVRIPRSYILKRKKIDFYGSLPEFAILFCAHTETIPVSELFGFQTMYMQKHNDTIFLQDQHFIQ